MAAQTGEVIAIHASAGGTIASDAPATGCRPSAARLATRSGTST